ncbi:capsular exopolysaccharide family protein [Coleofasciculus chthonoplastes PCC 7420]|uniref:Capsular exopolysaccharide family protein n=1 Tax=Coleofasciculus chthonoplastes PCC 7420 TaxID=118168 RepID=B4W1J6_9CYAN|nr:polysaccharide biosynthesis tyrosine autokinase [Coleofasciculus chthonoplastes]EDX71922.1 capsular exopolysaccharide family protein [Coleofasciculus chthonoplastes PCC 7420]
MPGTVAKEGFGCSTVNVTEVNMDIERDSPLSSNGKGDRHDLPLSADLTDEVTATPQRGLNLRPLLRTAKRKAWLIVGLTTLTTAAAWYVSSKEPPIYAGGFRLLVEPVTNEERASDPSSLARTSGVPSEQMFRLDYPTQIEILKGVGVLKPVVGEIETKFPGFSVGALRQGLTIEQVTVGKGRDSGTKILAVNYQSSDPKLAELVLEETAQKYLKYSLDERQSSISEGVKFIDEQLPKLQERVNNYQKQIQSIQERYDLIEPQSKGAELLGQVRDLENQQRATQQELRELRTLSTNLRQQLGLSPEEAIASSALSQDPRYQGLLGKIQEVESQIAIESARFAPDNPRMQALEEQRQNLLALLNQEAQRIIGENLKTTTNNADVMTFQNSVRMGLIQQLVEATNQIQLLEERSQQLAQTRATFAQQAQQMPEVIRQYTELQRQLEVATQTLNKLLTQRETFQVEEAGNKLPWEILSEPQILRDQYGNPMNMAESSQKMLLMGVMGGVVLGLGLGIIQEKIRDIFYSTEDLKDATDLPVLGEVPAYQNSHSQQDIEDTGTQSYQNATFLEAFDSIYTSIRFLFSDRPIRSLSVTSAALGDGKSTVALHLAQTAAQMGQRVLLVDANLIHPQIHQQLNLPNVKGLSDLLADNLMPHDFIERSPISDNLFVLTAGQPRPHLTRRFASAQMQELMAEFKTKFDLVVYDTPEFPSCMDISYLARHTDGLLMVTAIQKTKNSLVKQTITQLDAFGLPTLGIIANHIKRSGFMGLPPAPQDNSWEQTPVSVS